MRQKNTSIWLLALLLISIEQVIKLFIYQFHFDKYTEILPPIFYFSPMFNRDYSWYNSMLQLGISKAVHIIVTTVIIIVIILLFLFYSKEYKKIKLIDFAFIFLFSGSICSWIDKVFWNGSLDYIQLKGWFTFDLKDVYLNISIGLLLLLILKKHKTIDKFDEKTFFKAFLKFLGSPIKKNT